ncbi:MAG: multiheme c-type cytochrome [Bacteroidota bacterium]
MKYKILLFLFLSASVVACLQLKKDIHPLTQSWEMAIPNQEPPEGLYAINATSCAPCHREHYDEWRLSTHSHAWTDLQFQAEIRKESSPFMCINCHIPLQNQQEHIVTGLVDGDIYQPVKEENPHFDEELQQEGITCASCHVRDGAIIGAIGSKKAPHKVVKDPDFLSEKMCLSCHNATATLTTTLVCTFETGDEWKAGPYYGKKNCISCHMEEVERPIAVGHEKRISHRHWFAGSGIPKFDTVVTKMLNGYVFYPKEPTEKIALTDSITSQLTVRNELAGHRVPSGDPERFFLIHFALTNSAGDTVATQTDRIGEIWEWYPEAKKIADNNLYPNEERTFQFAHLPASKESLNLNVKVTKHRLDEKSAAYNGLGDNYPLFVEIYDENYSIEVE